MRRRLMHAVMLLSFASLPACSDALPAEPVQQPAEPAAPARAAADLFAEAVADARDRIMSALPAGDAPQKTQVLFEEISRAIDARDLHALRSALTRAEHVLGSLTDAERTADLAIELDALRLVLDHARSPSSLETRH